MLRVGHFQVDARCLEACILASLPDRPVRRLLSAGSHSVIPLLSEREWPASDLGLWKVGDAQERISYDILE